MLFLVALCAHMCVCLIYNKPLHSQDQHTLFYCLHKPSLAFCPLITSGKDLDRRGGRYGKTLSSTIKNLPMLAKKIYKQSGDRRNPCRWWRDYRSFEVTMRCNKWLAVREDVTVCLEFWFSLPIFESRVRNDYKTSSHATSFDLKARHCRYWYMVNMWGKCMTRFLHKKNGCVHWRGCIVALGTWTLIDMIWFLL